MRYQSKPSEIEAVQWTGDNLNEVVKFGVPGDIGVSKVSMVPGLNLELLAGVDGAQKWVPVPIGHWLVCAVKDGSADKSDIWPVEAEYFANKYEPVPTRIEVPTIDDLRKEENAE